MSTTSAARWPERVFRLVDDAGASGGDESDLEARVGIVRAFLMVHLAARAWVVLGPSSEAWESGFAVAMTAAAVASFLPLLARAAVAFAAALMLGIVVRRMPITANHEFLELFLVALLAFCDVRITAERALFVRTARWLTVLVLFWSGAQKILFGTYFHGEYLSFCVAAYEPFRDTLGKLLPDAEVARLASIDPQGTPSGPFRATAPLFLLASNGAYFGEIGLSLSLLARRTRARAAVAMMGLILLIEIAAREVFFGGLAFLMLLLFVSPRIGRRVLPLVLVLYAAALLSHVGILPDWTYKP